MKRYGISVALIAVLASCSLLSSDDPFLQESWGNGPQGELLSASKNSVMLQVGKCYVVKFSAPAMLVHGDSFDVSGVVTESTWDAQVGEPWHLSGVAHGDTVRMTWSFRTPGTNNWIRPVTDTVITGQEADPGFCLS